MVHRIIDLGPFESLSNKLNKADKLLENLEKTYGYDNEILDYHKNIIIDTINTISEDYVKLNPPEHTLIKERVKTTVDKLASHVWIFEDDRI